ncbi:MAG: 50S ribosomal protein L5 [Fidelibacterota bacterium]
MKRKVPVKKDDQKEYVPRLLEAYKRDIIPYMMKKFSYKNPLQVPKIEKICLNIGVGRAKEDPKLLEGAMSDLAVISGQKAVVTRAKRAISNFKIRANDPVGCRVTIRKKRAYEFLDRLINIAIPRVRDFNGLSDKSFDGKGNYSIGIKEQIIFSEIDYDKVDRIRGLDITIVTTAETDEEAYELLKAFGIPFRRRAA